jgi:serine/threonine protein kinase
VVKLHTTFQDTTFLYMLMEFLPGGDLMTMLIKYEIFTEDITRFYMAEITLAIEAVHKLGFIHRYVVLHAIYLAEQLTSAVTLSLTTSCSTEEATSS